MKLVVEVVYGASTRWTEMRLSPDAQDGPAHSTAVALPASSSCVLKLAPDAGSYGYGADQVRCPPHRSYSSSELILTICPAKTGSHETCTTSAMLPASPNSPWSTKEGSVRTEHSPAPASSAAGFTLTELSCAIAVPVRTNELTSKTMRAAKRPRLSMTSPQLTRRKERYARGASSCTLKSLLAENYQGCRAKSSDGDRARYRLRRMDARIAARSSTSPQGSCHQGATGRPCISPLLS